MELRVFPFPLVKTCLFFLSLSLDDENNDEDEDVVVVVVDVDDGKNGVDEVGDGHVRSFLRSFVRSIDLVPLKSNSLF